MSRQNDFYPVNRKQRMRKNPRVPRAVLEQSRRRHKYNYKYRENDEGNIENSSTFYVKTEVSYPHQIEEVFNKSIEDAKRMPEIFGEDFECDVQVNLVMKNTGEYMGYSFVDISNPNLYNVLIGLNPDGSERIEYGEDGDVKRYLPPIMPLAGYKYDEEQRRYMKADEEYGTLNISPAFIVPGVNEECDDCKLYVRNVPAEDYGFLYAIFARYARTDSGREHYPKITIKKCSRGSEQKYYSIVEYFDPYDAAFALCMFKKIRAKYNGEDIHMSVRYSFNSQHYIR